MPKPNPSDEDFPTSWKELFELQQRINAYEDGVMHKTKQQYGIDLTTFTEADYVLLGKYLQVRPTTLEMTADMLHVVGAAIDLAAMFLAIVLSDDPVLPDPKQDMEFRTLGEAYFVGTKRLMTLQEQIRRQAKVVLHEGLDLQRAGTLAQKVSTLQHLIPKLPDFPITGEDE